MDGPSRLSPFVAEWQFLQWVLKAALASSPAARELNRLARIGVIERRGTALLVKDVDRLAAMVQDATGE